MIYLLPVLAAILLPLLFIRLGLPLYINWQTEKNLLILNFEDKKVATAGGVILFLSLLLGYPFFPMLPFSLIFSPMLLFFYLFGVTFLGAIDDLWGEKECKGLRGHLKKFLRGEGVSTGIYKAAGGLLLGTFVSYRIYGGHWSFWFMGGLYLALLSNLFNLLDTRPGRVVKTFVLTSLPLILYFNFA
ncbi:MAG TPA: hypothetical protein GXZ24_07510, partial [Firmicutes bacterium]|nr:hypothetical protein [Bacillota bacterium]